MKPDLQVVSLPLAEALKKAGYPQKGIWKWTNYSQAETPLWELEPCYNNLMSIDVIAPTVSELGIALPYNTVFTKGSIYRVDFDNHYEKSIQEAGSRAKMWLWLKHEGRLQDG